VEEIERSKKRSYHLKNLYLDPNNYRFVDNEDYTPVPDEKILDINVQKRTRKFIEGEKRENIKDLLSSFKANGFLDVDVIQVRDLGDNRYLVIEGNRRVATLKALQDDYENGLDIGNLNPEIFKKVPFEIHNNETKEKHLIIMGLKHISGNKKWSAINQAKLIYDFLKPYKQTDEYYQKENELCSSLGISKQLLRVSQRAYHLILEYKRSDYGEQFKSDDYSIFVEIVKKPAIKEWLEWDDYIYTPVNKANMERLFSWISKNYETNEEYRDEIVETEPIITKAHEIRDLAIFINDEKALNVMEETKSVSQALIASGKAEQINFEKILNDLDNKIFELSRFKSLISTSDDIEKVKEIKNRFLEIFPKESSIKFQKGNIEISFKYGISNHFENIFIKNYKIFKNFKLNNLNKINIIAGPNNSGKTSLLEAVYLLTKQNDIASFLEMIQLKNKLSHLSSLWLNRYLQQSIDIEGKFNKINTGIKFNKFEADNIDKKNDYITSYRLSAFLEGREELINIIHTYEHNDLKRENKMIENLCKSVFKSPYFYNFNEIKNCYSVNTELKINEKTAFSIVLDFIKKIDPNINDIRFSDGDGIERFIVDSSIFKETNLDISHYGEGLQRIFEIVLSFAYCRNGVICIDEFETAIHYTLLVDFTRFIQELSDIFNVQVFLTTHSKEAIEAFVKNGYKNSDIALCTLLNRDGNIEQINYDSNLLQDQLSQDLEIRGWQ